MLRLPQRQINLDRKGQHRLRLESGGGTFNNDSKDEDEENVGENTKTPFLLHLLSMEIFRHRHRKRRLAVVSKFPSRRTNENRQDQFLCAAAPGYIYYESVRFSPTFNQCTFFTICWSFRGRIPGSTLLTFVIQRVVALPLQAAKRGWFRCYVWLSQEHYCP